MVLLIIGVYVSMDFPFSVFGGVINGFQRYDLNNMVGIGTASSSRWSTSSMLLAGCGLVALVAATTACASLAFFVYRRNAYRVFPALSIRPSLFRRRALSEVTGFSVYVVVIDWSNKLNYSIDALVIGAYRRPRGGRALDRRRSGSPSCCSGSPTS